MTCITIIITMVAEGPPFWQARSAKDSNHLNYAKMFGGLSPLGDGGIKPALPHTERLDRTVPIQRFCALIQ
jgi:hypothetical protein